MDGESDDAKQSEVQGEEALGLNDQNPDYRFIAFNSLTRAHSTSTLPTKPYSASVSLVQLWNIDSPLPLRPFDLPRLELVNGVSSTHRVVMGVSADIISNRISHCLQSRSIEVRFCQKRSNVANCRNIEFSRFTVKLWGVKNGEEGVHVEVQKICGDSGSFNRDCRSILNAAEGITSFKNESEDIPLYQRRPALSMSFLKNVKVQELDEEKALADELRVTSDLLSSKQCEAIILGMEKLAIITNPNKIRRSVAMAASRWVLCPTDNVKKHPFNLHKYVMSLLVTDENRFTDLSYDDASTTSSQNNIAVMIAFDDHAARLRNLGMIVLFNALSLLSDEGQLSSVLTPHEGWYMIELLPQLIEDLQSAAYHLQDACYACRCLSILANSSMTFAARMEELGVHDALCIAEEVGMREFALLEQDAGMCLRSLITTL